MGILGSRYEQMIPIIGCLDAKNGLQPARDEHTIVISEECPICFEPIHDKKTLSCGHSFCTKCAKKWKRHSKNLTGKNTCPICRRNMGVGLGCC